jgi:hypothetical protein
MMERLQPTAHIWQREVWCAFGHCRAMAWGERASRAIAPPQARQGET